jgi:uncharacterized protein (DUF2252 family)
MTALPTVAERRAAGKLIRRDVPRASHAAWKPSPSRPDPLSLLRSQNKTRVPVLVPIRYWRMLQSPFTFFRGAAAIMAADLAGTPDTDIAVQACGDCHLMNFGAYATEERNFVFDICDFDETLRAPWEWDVKRLAASFVVAGRDIKLTERQCRDAVAVGVGAYRERLAAYANMTNLGVWYSRLDVDAIPQQALATGKKARARFARMAEKLRARAQDADFNKLAEFVDGRPRFIDNPPGVYHPSSMPGTGRAIRAELEAYRASLRDDLRVLFDRYEVFDVAVKVVGVGSVGTRCAIVLLMARDDDPLILQIKEADASVLEAYAKPSGFANQGERVVNGQRIMQTASDMLLGWTAYNGRDYYIRQLRDMKSSVVIEVMDALDLAEYARVCGMTLARAHARSGDPARLSGYLGNGDAFDLAIADFAVAYADQNERDYAVLKATVRAKKIRTEKG